MKISTIKTAIVELEQEEFDILMRLVGSMSDVDEHTFGLNDYQREVVNALFNHWWDSGLYSKLKEFE